MLNALDRVVILPRPVGPHRNSPALGNGRVGCLSPDRKMSEKVSHELWRITFSDIYEARLIPRRPGTGDAG
jgi:hypothetical protein